MVRLCDPMVTSAMPRTTQRSEQCMKTNRSAFRSAASLPIPARDLSNSSRFGSYLSEDDIMHLNDQNVRPQVPIRHSAAVGWRLRWSKRRSNTCSAMRFFKISTEPPAIIQPRVRRMQYSTSVSRENPMAQSRDVLPESKEPRETRGSFILIQLTDRSYFPTGKKYAIPAVAI